MNSDTLESTLRLLHGLKRHVSTPEQNAALSDSMLILYFILARHEEDEFEQFLKSSTKRPLASSLSFPTKEAADAWLQSHPAPPHGAYIGVGEALYHVAYSRELKHRKLLPLPTQEEWAQMEAEPEKAVDEGLDVAPPKPGPEFNLFTLYTFVCFHLHALEQRLSSSEEREALRVARLSFEFVMGSGEYHGLEEYLETLRTSRTSPPLHFFSAREDAESWLRTQPEPPAPAVISIGHDLYSVGYHRRRALPMLLRLPSLQELDAGAP
ncbi:MAG: hypothetical protein ABW123_26190 [Cystobacter sp.]